MIYCSISETHRMQVPRSGICSTNGQLECFTLEDVVREMAGQPCLFVESTGSYSDSARNLQNPDHAVA